MKSISSSFTYEGKIIYFHVVSENIFVCKHLAPNRTGIYSHGLSGNLPKFIMLQSLP